MPPGPIRAGRLAGRVGAWEPPIRSCLRARNASRSTTAAGSSLSGAALATLADRQPIMATRQNELIHRLLAGKCVLCEARDGPQVHHLRKLADLNKPSRPERPTWVVLVATRRRKTLVVCSACHRDIHQGRATTTTRN